MLHKDCNKLERVEVTGNLQQIRQEMIFSFQYFSANIVLVYRSHGPIYKLRVIAPEHASISVCVCVFVCVCVCVNI